MSIRLQYFRRPAGLRPGVVLPLLCLLLPIALSAQVNHVVISQVFGGGGNSGAPYKNDFIELYNPTSAYVSLSGWSVQYTSKTGTSWSVTALVGSIAPGKYYLVQEAAGSSTTEPSLPTPQATGTIAMSQSDGKVALVASAIALSGSCPLAAAVDFIGFGAADCAEGTKTAAISNITAAIRKSSGLQDTDNNLSDFTTNTAPSPHANAAVPQSIKTAPQLSAAIGMPFSAPLAGEGAYSYTYVLASGALPSWLTMTGDGNLTGTPGTADGSPFTFTIQATDDSAAPVTTIRQFTLTVVSFTTCAGALPIYQVQGTGATSPYAGQAVLTSGIVTGVKSGGFFMESRTLNGGVASDGIYVFTSSAPPVLAAVGNEVCVSGTVTEYGAGNSLTEIKSPSVGLVSVSNPLPTPVAITDTITDWSSAVVERYESMRVTFPNDLTVVAPTTGTVTEISATAVSNGFFKTVMPGVPRPFRTPGLEPGQTIPAGAPSTIPQWNGNPQILSVGSFSPSLFLEAGAGAMVKKPTGVMDVYGGSLELMLDSPATIEDQPSAQRLPAATNGQVTVAAFNLEHFYNDQSTDNASSAVTLTTAAYQNRLKKASLSIRTILNSPDVISVEEMENIATLQALAAKIQTDGGPAYSACLELGNDVGGINVGFLVNTAKVNIVSCTQYGKDTYYVTPAGGSELLNDRPPLVLKATATAPGSAKPWPFTVISNHLRSLNGIDDESSNSAGPRVRAKRERQAEYLANLIQSFQASGENVISVGDYNAYDFTDGYVDVVGIVKGAQAPASTVTLTGPSPEITSPALVNLADLSTQPADQKYSYTYNGSAQTIDHALATTTMAANLADFRNFHVDADFPESYRSDPNRPERLSDHDGLVAYFDVPAFHAPVAVAQSFKALAGVALTFTPNATDADGGTLSFAVTTPPAQGSAAFSSGVGTYTPNANASGADSFLYTVTDNTGLTANATVTFNVAADVTSQVKVTANTLLWNRATKVFTGTVTVKNTGATAIGGPVELVFNGLPAGITLANKTGVAPNGSPYLKVSDAGIAAGASVTVSVQFASPNSTLVSYGVKLYSGAF
jgi:uncharacterized protein